MKFGMYNKFLRKENSMKYLNILVLLSNTVVILDILQLIKYLEKRWTNSILYLKTPLELIEVKGRILF